MDKSATDSTETVNQREAEVYPCGNYSADADWLHLETGDVVGVLRFVPDVRRGEIFKDR